MKIKIIEGTSCYDLEKMINNYLSSCDCSKIFDIKYTGCGSYSPHGITYYSVMIIFK